MLYLLIVMTMFPWYFNTQISFGYVNIYSLDMIFAIFSLFAGALILTRYINKKTIFPIPIESKPLLLFILLYFILHLLYLFAGLFKGVPLDSDIRRFLVFSGFFYFFFPILFLRNTSQLRSLLIFTVILVVLFPGYQVYRFMAASSLTRFITSSGTIRVTSSGIPIIAAGLFMILIWNTKIRYYLISVCPIISILLSGHRSAFLAIAISLIFLFYFNKKLTKPILFCYFTGFALITALIGIELFTGHSFYDDAVKRSSDILNMENATTQAREYSIQDNLYVFRNRPFFGVGYYHEQLPGLFRQPDYKNRNISDSSDLGGPFNVIHPHNFLLRLLSNTGLLGTSVLLIIIFLVLQRCYSLIKMKGPSHDIGVFLFCSIFFFIVFSLMNTSFFSEGHIFWILCGVAAIWNEDMLKIHSAPDTDTTLQPNAA